MKFRNSPFLLALALVVLSPLMSHAGACSNSTIQGSYAFTIHGQVFLPNGSTLLIDGLAKTTFDGDGNLTQLDAVAANGNVAPGWASNTGTYSVNPDCTGAFTDENWQPINDGLVTGGGNHIWNQEEGNTPVAKGLPNGAMSRNLFCFFLSLQLIANPFALIQGKPWGVLRPIG